MSRDKWTLYYTNIEDSDKEKYSMYSDGRILPAQNEYHQIL